VSDPDDQTHAPQPAPCPALPADESDMLQAWINQLLSKDDEDSLLSE